jgi:hypothetical protein
MTVEMEWPIIALGPDSTVPLSSARQLETLSKRALKNRYLERTAFVDSAGRSFRVASYDASRGPFWRPTANVHITKLEFEFVRLCTIEELRQDILTRLSDEADLWEEGGQLEETRAAVLRASDAHELVAALVDPS